MPAAVFPFRLLSYQLLFFFGKLAGSGFFPWGRRRQRVFPPLQQFLPCWDCGAAFVFPFTGPKLKNCKFFPCGSAFFVAMFVSSFFPFLPVGSLAALFPLVRVVRRGFRVTPFLRCAPRLAGTLRSVHGLALLAKTGRPRFHLVRFVRNLTLYEPLPGSRRFDSYGSVPRFLRFLLYGRVQVRKARCLLQV